LIFDFISYSDSVVNNLVFFVSRQHRN